MTEKSYNVVTKEDVDKEPKADLHFHLDGGLTREIIWQVSQNNGIEIPDLPEQTFEALASVYPDPGPFGAGQPDKFDDFLKLFNRAFSVMLTPKTIYESTLEVIRDLKKQNIIYAELRFAPNYHITKGHSMDGIVESVLKAMKDGEKETGTMTRLILSIPREIAYDPDYKGPSANDIVDTALRFQDEDVVAIDLTCNEALYPPERYIEAFQRTINSKLKRTVHAGETGPRQLNNIFSAIECMGADGLGHALKLPDMRMHLEKAKEKKIRIERCPISNRCMQLDDGDFDNLDRLIDSGVLVSVNSDDPGIFGPLCSLSNNLLAVANRYQWGIEGVRQLTRNAAMSAFLRGKEKEELLKKLEAHQ